MVLNKKYACSPNYNFDKMDDMMIDTLVALGDIMIVDKDGRYIFVTESYCRSMGLVMEEIIDKKISDVLDNTEIPTVLRTGQASTSAIYHRNNQTYWVKRCPIKRNGEIIGVIAQAIMAEENTSAEIRKKLAYLTRSLNYYKDKYEQKSRPKFSLDGIVASSKVMMELKDTIRQIGSTKSTVLLTGESGTGKEVFANAIHYYSARAGKPFVKINCAAIPEHLLESELFGYKEGAFTGAVKGGKIGDFEAADGGTIFLDEVNSLSMNFQAKLLRVIQEKEIKKIGESTGIPIDVRFIFATNRDLQELVREGKFREDFYYRINVINLKIPPLREHTDDIEPLVAHFIKKFNKEFDADITGLTPDALLALQNYSWPGNIRELENCIERAFNFAGSGNLELKHLHLRQNTIYQNDDKTSVPITLREAREQAEKAAIIRTLKATGGNKKEAAAILQIDRSILYDKIKKYDILPELL